MAALGVAGVPAGCGTNGAHSGRPSSDSPASSAAPSRAVGPPAPAPAERSVDLAARGDAAAHVVGDFYRAVNKRQWADAWSRLSPAVQQRFGGMTSWQSGFQHTDSTTVLSAVGTAGSATTATVDVTLRSVDTDACGRAVTQRFTGTWTLARGNGRWAATAIALAKSGGGTLRTADQCADAATGGTSRAETDTTASGNTTKVCFPEVKLPEVRLPTVHLPKVTLPAVTIGDTHIPARTIPSSTIAARTIPARTIPGRCVDAPNSFALNKTTVRISGYDTLDPSYSPR